MTQTARLLGAGATGPGIVHLGSGAFARGHLWWATALAVDAEPGPWNVTAVAQRSRRVIDALQRHEWRYDVRLVGAETDRTDTVALVRDGLVASEEPDRLFEALTHPDTQIVTVTATEAGYPATSAGRLDTEDAAVAADVIQGPSGPWRSVAGQVAGAAAARGALGHAPLSVLVCDNLRSGGQVLRAHATQLALSWGAVDVAEELSRWAFPTSVVDRVVPAVPPDEQPHVVADPTFRWVIEDDFAGSRPAWEHAGVQVVADPQPWERAKLCLVNASHSLIAYLGLRLGHEDVPAAMADDLVRAAVESALDRELVGCVPPAPGLDPVEEASATVSRFRSQVVPHALSQVGSEGSRKLPERLAPALERWRAGEAPSAGWSALTIALWLVALERGEVQDSRAREVLAIRGVPRARAARLLELLGLGSDEAAVHLLAERIEAVGDGTDLSDLLGSNLNEESE